MSTQDQSGKNAGSGANEPLPADFEEKAKQRFATLKLELPFEQYLEGEKAEFARQAALQRSPASKYVPTLGTMTPCGNGDFEDPARGIDAAEWQGAYSLVTAGTVTSAGNIDFTVMTAGILPGGLTMGTIANQSSQAHQTWVASGADPLVPIQTTAPGSSGAVRIGNARWGGGCELLSKTFVVTPAQSTIAFWYAAVLQDPPGHSQSIKPYFMVRVTDAAGNVIPGAFDFGSGTGNKLVADSTNPFFQSIFIPSVVAGAPPILVAYRDWSCAQIDLSSQIDPVTQIGKQVTIEFVTADCMWGGCFGYAYIDNFCGDCAGSPTGNITFDDASSTHCGPGQICFDYTLPTTRDPKGNQVTGSVVITLEIFQSGALTPLTTLVSPMLSSGTSYCFNITPATIPGINMALGGFDFAATATFAIGGTGLGQIKVGTAPYGITPGENNDYKISCQKSCAEIAQDQAAYLSTQCAKKVNLLPRTSCDGEQGHPSSVPGTVGTPGTPGTPDKGDCNCDCVALQLPDVKPCISVAWGDSQCDCMETDDVEVLCVTVCNCYSNVTFSDLVIGHVQITDMAGNPVPTLPDGTPSVQVIPSGPICFGDIGPCEGRNKPSCVSRELVLYTRGAVGKDYKLSFEGVCFSVCQNFQVEECFVVKLCQD